MKYRWGLWLFLGVVLTACTLSSEDKAPEPTTQNTSVAGVATNTIEPTEENTPAATTTIEPTAQSLAAPTVDLTDTPLPSPTPTATPSITPPASLTPSINEIVPTDEPTTEPTTAPTSTQPTSAAVAPAPSETPLVAPSPVHTFVAPPTFTPAIWPTQTPITAPATLPAPTQEQGASGSAVVCATCGQLRLRESPGTAGNIITELAANTAVTIIGRTEDNVWVEISLTSGAAGWVATQYLEFTLDLSLVSITGVAENTAFPTAAPVTGPGGGDVVSGVSYTARQIFLNGRAKGNSAYTFTRVGDSITASPYFLTQIGNGAYELGEYGYLGGAISFFSGPNGRGMNPFGASSIAAHNGWSTESVLDPALSDKGICGAAETPLECEYRVVKPSVALIMFGTNDSGGLPTNQYTANLHRIVQISIDMGVIPVLSTIPPKHYDPRTDGRVAEFNQVIIATARTYDIPLWDYYSVMDSLPSDGLAPDGVHPSIPPSGSSVIFDATGLQYGYTVRNLTALQVLYTLWQQVLYDGDSAPPATSDPVIVDPGEPVDPGQPVDSGDCTGTLPARLTVGGQGRVTPGLPNKMRLEPSLASAQIGNIPGEGVFSVIGGPHCADGFLWWKVTYGSTTGWTANGDGTDYWVEP